MSFKMYKGLKWVGRCGSAIVDFVSPGVLIGGFLFILACIIGLWMYAIGTMTQGSEWIGVGEIGSLTNKVATFSFQSDDPVHLVWEWQNSNRWPEIHVSCDLINAAKKPVYFTTESDYSKLEPGAKVRFFEGSLSSLISNNAVYFKSGDKKLKLSMHFDEDFKPEPTIKVLLHNDRPVL
ncbi:hypothetical protein [Pedosphaera parvula]|uniref:Uncharacterized protein n=1 Tax=Pedosphaera parvula (strain Ellin514) TaxID=320771 RepID=B9XKL7_PEDPL|nr:hypothetical protein [Pedosphaera parvula]EEF59687.1 hypothetical protein Cflav_PD2676 [Pedosphaera parvula Ellin514]